jgi:hypothetical protein
LWLPFLSSQGTAAVTRDLGITSDHQILLAALLAALPRILVVVGNGVGLKMGIKIENVIRLTTKIGRLKTVRLICLI